MTDVASTESRLAILSSLAEMARTVSPMSASGGWFTVAAIAHHTGYTGSTVALRLRQLEGEGLVVCKDHKRNLTRWRLKAA